MGVQRSPIRFTYWFTIDANFIRALEIGEKIPGSKEGVSAIEEAISAGIRVHVTLLSSTNQYLAAAVASMCGLERRVADRLHANVALVASTFVSRWDKAILGKRPEALHSKLRIAVAQRTYRAYWKLVNTQRWQALQAAGARRSVFCGPAPAPSVPVPRRISTSARWRPPEP